MIEPRSTALMTGALVTKPSLMLFNVNTLVFLDATTKGSEKSLGP